MWETLAGGGVWSGRLVNRRKDGSHFEEAATISPIRDAAGETVSYVAVKRDVTEDVALRRELMQAQKMESIGRLASGIAHDFNNLMGQILGAAEMILCRARESGLEEYLELIFEAVNRGRNITSRMLNFSRAGEEGVEAVAVGEILTDLEQVGKHTFPKEIELRFDAEEEIHLQCDRTQIQQVLMNLCINAVDAMSGAGMLSVRARRATADETRRHGNGRGERYACLMVSDSGAGIDSEVVHEIFDPFFTSKPPGKGTGLGLFIVYGIIRSHGGWIEVDTAPGSGTTFTLGLPVTGAPADPTSETSPALPEGGGQHILVVDDEAGLVQLLTEVLSDANYRVSSAGDGREALAFFEASAYDIDLVITDIGMPRMGGRDLVERLRRIDGGLDIIVTSGFVDASDFAELARFGVRKVLTKPFEVDEVLRTVGEVFLAPTR
jgi:signal transduction histidine kinase